MVYRSSIDYDWSRPIKCCVYSKQRVNFPFDVTPVVAQFHNSTQGGIIESSSLLRYFIPCTGHAKQLSESGQLSLCVCYRLIITLSWLFYTRAGQSERRVPPAPIRPPERPKANSRDSNLDTSEYQCHLAAPLRRLYFLNTFPRLSNSSLLFGEIET